MPVPADQITISAPLHPEGELIGMLLAIGGRAWTWRRFWRRAKAATIVRVLAVSEDGLTLTVTRDFTGFGEPGRGYPVVNSGYRTVAEQNHIRPNSGYPHRYDDWPWPR